MILFLLNQLISLRVNKKGKLEIYFDNVVGSQDLILNKTTYYNCFGEDFTVSRFSYFVSNFKFYKSDGSVYIVPQDSSYFLIRERNPESLTIRLDNIPVGEYERLEFFVGVDSMRNVSPLEKRKGVLDPGYNVRDESMYWTWNNGYIFMKLEGKSSVGNPVNGRFHYHIGLFGGYREKTVNNTRIVKISFNDDRVIVDRDKTPKIELRTDVLKFFNGNSINLSIRENSGVMAGQQELSAKLADNYQNMFSYYRTTP